MQIIGENKLHSLYLWIHLKPEANVKECAKVAATLQTKVQQVMGEDLDSEDEILAGVGFGPNFYGLVSFIVVEISLVHTGLHSTKHFPRTA